MNFKLIDLAKFNTNSQKIFSEKLPLTCAYKLSKIQKEIADDIEFYQKKYFEIVEEYGKKDSNGNLEYSQDGLVVLIEPDKMEEAQKKIDELNEMNISLNIEDYLLELSDFDKDIRMSMEDINGILPFIK